MCLFLGQPATGAKKALRGSGRGGGGFVLFLVEGTANRALMLQISAVCVSDEVYLCSRPGGGRQKEKESKEVRKRGHMVVDV